LRAAVRLCNRERESRTVSVVGGKGKRAYQGKRPIVHEFVNPRGRPCVLCGKPSLDERRAVITPQKMVLEPR